MLQRVYFLRCLNPDCGDTIVLPRRSRLGVFELPLCQPTEEWPIDYRCTYCGHASRLEADAIRSGTVEAGDQNPDTENLCCYEFSSDQTRSSPQDAAELNGAGSHRLYAKGLIRASGDELVELIRDRASGDDSLKPRFVGVQPIPF
jgi:hypothetical protein